MLMLLLSRPERITDFVKAALWKDLARHIDSFHSHCLRICVATLAHRNADVSSVAAVTMNHSETMAKSYLRNQGRGVLELQSFMDDQVATTGRMEPSTAPAATAATAAMAATAAPAATAA